MQNDYNQLVCLKERREGGSSSAIRRKYGNPIFLNPTPEYRNEVHRNSISKQAFFFCSGLPIGNARSRLDL